MSLEDGYLESTGAAKRYWKVPKEFDQKAGLLYCKSLDKNVRALAGRLVKIEAGEDEWEGNVTYNLRLTLRSANFDNVFQCGRFTFMGRDIINSLSTQKNISYIAVTPYVSATPDGKEFLHCSVRAADAMDKLMDDGSKLKSSVNKEDIPAVVEVKVGNKKVLDTEARDNYFNNLIIKISENIAPIVDESNDETPF